MRTRLILALLQTFRNNEPDIQAFNALCERDSRLKALIDAAYVLNKLRSTGSEAGTQTQGMQYWIAHEVHLIKGRSDLALNDMELEEKASKTYESGTTKTVTQYDSQYIAFRRQVIQELVKWDRGYATVRIPDYGQYALFMKADKALHDAKMRTLRFQVVDVGDFRPYATVKLELVDKVEHLFFMDAFMEQHPEFKEKLLVNSIHATARMQEVYATLNEGGVPYNLEGRFMPHFAKYGVDEETARRAARAGQNYYNKHSRHLITDRRDENNVINTNVYRKGGMNEEETATLDELIDQGDFIGVANLRRYCLPEILDRWRRNMSGEGTEDILASVVYTDIVYKNRNCEDIELVPSGHNVGDVLFGGLPRSAREMAAMKTECRRHPILMQGDIDYEIMWRGLHMIEAFPNSNHISALVQPYVSRILGIPVEPTPAELFKAVASNADTIVARAERS
jgi:hypothetical protein